MTSSSSAEAATATSKPTGVVYSGFGGQTTPAAEAGGNEGGKSAGVLAMDLGKSYGLAVVLTGVFAGFALVL